MKTLIPIFCFFIILTSCSKTLYNYNVYEMEECLDIDKIRNTKKDISKFNEGFFVYENCSGTKEIDGVSVNWIEDDECAGWKEVDRELNFSTDRRGHVLDSLTNKVTRKLEVPQRFFLVFLDEKRVLYFTNYEASKNFKKRIKSVYKNIDDNNEFDLNTLKRSSENINKLDTCLQKYFKTRGWSESDYAFANYNLYNWGDSLLTFNQEIPLRENSWRRYMKGVYKTYQDTTGHYVKIAFDKGHTKIKTKDIGTSKVDGKGIIELTFHSPDDNYENLELVVMNIPDASVNLKGEEGKGSKRRNVFIKNTFAIRPIFSFHREPLKFTLEDGKKIKYMTCRSFAVGRNKYTETWYFEDGTSVDNPLVRENKIWWHE